MTVKKVSDVISGKIQRRCVSETGAVPVIHRDELSQDKARWSVKRTVLNVSGRRNGLGRNEKHPTTESRDRVRDS